MISYKNAIHPDFGNYTIKNDIIVTPFWTRAFCDELAGICDEVQDRFAIREPEYGTFELKLNDISRILFTDYATHFNSEVLPMLRKEWFINKVEGMFSPYILRYSQNTARSLQLHTDVSIFTTYIQLNDNYKGCHVTFPRQNFCVDSVPVGHAIFWPSLVTHSHYVSELISGVKYSFTSFVWPPSWSDDTGIRF
jgi:hypothetical protein